MDCNKLKIIIDTDIGDDIDDTFALLLAARSPEIEIVGVTTVFRNASRRARMCKAVLNTYNIFDIPVYAGTDTPFIQKVFSRENDRYDDGGFIPCQFTREMEQLPYKEDVHAVDFIIETVNKYPNEVVIVAIGPLTNIAMAIRKSPKIVNKVKGITLMGGLISEQKPEWNIVCDPEAARIVYTSGIPVNAVGLDVTMKCRLTMESMEEFKKLQTKTSRLVYDMTLKWLEHYKFDCPVLHDPLTIGTLIDPSFVRFESKAVSVVTEGGNRGCTIVKEEADGLTSSVVNVAVDVDYERYIDFFKRRIFN